MTLFLALSCLQGRPRTSAAQELMSLDVDGLQLTPGNPPDPAFMPTLRASGTRFQTHHGYIETCLRAPVWDGAECVLASDSIHPPRAPKSGALQQAEWRKTVADNANSDRASVIELMYPGYFLGDGEGAEWAMESKLPLAVDVSHIYIQRMRGVMTESTWRKLQGYEHVREVHVSANDGTHDSHRPLDARSFGLDWARERMRAGTLCVVECYMHKLEQGERQRQVALVRGES